jgi:hypothetical protein
MARACSLSSKPRETTRVEIAAARTMAAISIRGPSGESCEGVGKVGEQNYDRDGS